MNYRLKPEYADQIIKVGLINKNVMGKFIDPEIYPWLFSKYPELFEEYEPFEEIDESEFLKGISKKENYKGK